MAGSNPLHEGRRLADPDAPQSQRLRVLLANEDDAKLGPIADVVAEMGHVVIARAVEVAAVAEIVARERPDIALVRLGPSTDHALGLIDRIAREAACPVIALLHAHDPDFVVQASLRGISAAITGRDPAEWQCAIDVVLCRFADYNNLRAAFARRATVERASGILMERHSVSSEAAFAMLRETARRGNRKLGELAAAVVDGHSLLPAADVGATS